MKIMLLAAMTIDGKIARNEQHFVDWSSPEDKKLFRTTSKEARVIIMGNNTYRTLPAPLSGRLHIVLTTTLEGKEQKPGAVEFTSDMPEKIVAGLEARGYTEAVLIGGAQVNSLFLLADHVDEIWLTIEPFIFGVGLDVFRGVSFDLKPRLLQVEKLNEGGSVLLKYSLR